MGEVTTPISRGDVVSVNIRIKEILDTEDGLVYVGHPLTRVHSVAIFKEEDIAQNVVTQK